MAGQKSVSKSIRLTPDLYDYISSYRGDGFNEKFANIIMDARDSEAARQRHLALLDEKIEKREEFLVEAALRVEELQRLFRTATGSWW